VQVPAWQNTPPQDPEAIKMLEDEYFRSNYDLRSMLRVLFNADFFKNARFAKVKSPAESVIGTMRLVGDFTAPKPGMPAIVAEMRYMGQDGQPADRGRLAYGPGVDRQRHPWSNASISPPTSWGTSSCQASAPSSTA
jgi:hypothetical protein